MRKFIINDTINDIAIIQTSFGFNVRYGLQIERFDTLHAALSNFKTCLDHAMIDEFGNLLDA